MEKTSSSSRIVISEVMMPSKANVAGNIHGGEIIKLMDSAAYVSARRYARSNVVTARVDELEFHLPIFIGDLVICTAQVVYVGKSSMEVTVSVEVEDIENGTPQKALSAFFTMVAIDKKGKPHILPELIIETESERWAFTEGKKRHEEHKGRKCQSD
ncbi:MAG: acyl-CoA thioesterase [Acidaminococcales bacterium]|nr:acyl-CoA thioesterase [Acidaminococcales bacterium]